MDGRLRASERAALTGGPAARHQFAAELERAGVLEAVERDVLSLLDRVQPADAAWPTTSKLDGAAIAAVVQEVARSATSTWRLHIADHHFRSPTASPEGTYAVVVLHGDMIVVGVDRGDTRLAATFKRDLTTAEPLSALAVLSGPCRLGVVRVGRSTAAAWSRWRLRRARLEGIEHARRRPAMYVGDTRARGVRALVDELLDRAVELHAAGRCQGVRVRLLPEGVCSIADDGPGVPSAIDERTDSPTLEAVFTDPAPGGGGDYAVGGGSHGLGLWVVNALSAWLELESRHDGVVVRQRFERGHPTAPPVLHGSTAETGVTVTFQPDPTIFAPPAEVEVDWLSQRLRELSVVNPGFRATLEVSEAARPPEVHHSEQGAVDGLQAMVRDDEALLASPLVVHGREATAPGELPVLVEAALTWTRREGEVVADYVNSVRLSEGGPHLTALRAAVTRAFAPLGAEGRRGVNYREGLVAFVSLKVPAPRYEGCTRTKLANAEVGPIVGRLIARALATFLKERPAEARAVVAQALARSRRKKLPRAAGVKP